MTSTLKLTRTGLLFFMARFGFLGFYGLLAATAATAQIGVVGNTGIDTSGDYAQERAWCQANTAGVALTDCLKNSGAARVEKRRGTLSNSGNFEANAMMRCEPFKGEDLAACRARVAGQGGVSGSVMGGGRIQQVETVILPSGQGAITFEQKMPYPVIIVPATGN
jgi:hypothetical protein